MWVRIETILRASVQDGEGNTHARCHHDHTTLTEAYDCGTALLVGLSEHAVQDVEPMSPRHKWFL